MKGCKGAFSKLVLGLSHPKSNLLQMNMNEVLSAVEKDPKEKQWSEKDRLGSSDSRHFE